MFNVICVKRIIKHYFFIVAMAFDTGVHLRHSNRLSSIKVKGVGEDGAGGGGGARASPLSKVGGGEGTSGFVAPPPPTFGQSKCSNFTICTYFVVKNTIFSKFSWLTSLANFNKSIFSKLC